MVRDNNIVAGAKLLVKDIDNETINNLWLKYLKPFLKQKTPAVFNKISITIPSVYVYQTINYISKRYTPLRRVYTNTGDWQILDECGIVAALPDDVGKNVDITIEYGTDDIVEYAESVFARILAEVCVLVSKGALGVESISNSFDVSTVTTKFNFTEWDMYQKLLVDWWVDANRKEPGCIV